MFLALALLPVYIIALMLIASSIKILREYERAVVFRLGRFQAVKGPGLILIVPFVQQIVRVDLRTVVMEVPGQDVISRDNVSLKVDAILYFRVVDAQRAIIQVENFLSATNMLAQTTLRSVLGEHELDEVLAKRTEINAAVQSTLDVQTESWGIKVISVEIREVTLTENMIRAIAKQAEAERDRRAKVIHAEAEFQAAQTLLDAARNPDRRPRGHAVALPADTHGSWWRAEFDDRLSNADRPHQTIPTDHAEPCEGYVGGIKRSKGA
jgi:regulator of protease activity HflC (stomatin/prohibitin superfamily)